jgi:hypothetical protein
MKMKMGNKILDYSVMQDIEIGFLHLKRHRQKCQSMLTSMGDKTEGVITD